MATIDEKILSALKEDTGVPEVSEYPTQKEGSNNLYDKATEVMAAYQNANKWLDTIKECLLMDMNCAFFSSYVHNLAHTMPVRFDSFGDILHTIDMKIPYPATEYIASEPKDISESITQVCDILGGIESALSSFIDAAKGLGKRSAALSAENLLSDISTEYTTLYDIRRALNASKGEVIKFDKWVAQYINNKNALLG